MIKWPWTKSKPAPVKKVKLDIIHAIELKPEANYILVADSRHFSKTELSKIMTDLRRIGVRNVVSFLLSGEPGDAIQLISKEKKKHATNKARY